MSQASVDPRQYSYAIMQAATDPIVASSGASPINFACLRGFLSMVVPGGCWIVPEDIAIFHEPGGRACKDQEECGMSKME